VATNLSGGKTMTTLRVLGLLALALAAGCTDTIQHQTDGSLEGPTPDKGIPGEARIDRTRADVVGEGGGGTISIYIKGDKTAVTFSDGFAGQTPKEYKMGLGRYDIMTSPSDPAPVTVFDHGAKPVDVDLLGTTLGGAAKIAALPAGTYTHGRVLLTSATFTIAAIVHAGLAVPGDIRVVSALSDTTIDGTSWTQGKTTFTFIAGAIQQTVPGVIPPLPSTGGGSIVQTGGKTWMIFPFPTPLTLYPSMKKDYQATIIYKVFESFRWEDQSLPGYTAKVFDVDALKLTFEPVRNFGATGYGVEIK
jgi:hypothetical protein